ncbi:Gfo/Idh/MocA family protein [Vibrio sp. SCSIO 43137]|uniref:Gfo/Idh/MocA family protein n=1 Tax=Vibrio sp. SCSIO 43137 TaxID=3021011 RepID=UPI0023075C8E|nr:Gfo/Idh/MocA family oxidoreductase [Vibrio sp. SCSIO 43137]WCE31184.1 Gfo/Idh/MocA family oxidoreductase [Vibrio sp. SCSIO 43137]
MKKVAVIGLGNIATRHRRNLKQLFPEATLFAMSASGRVPNETVENCDIVATSIEELIDKEVELVIVASPATFHARHAVPLIEAGIPTLIEKPVTADNKDSKILSDTVSKHSTPVAIGYCLRYLPSAKVVKSVLDENKLGCLYNSFVHIGQYLPDWRPSKDYRSSVSANAELGGGALLELSHEVDYSRWLLGTLNLQHALLRSSAELALDVEDMADITLTAEDGSVVQLHLDFMQRTANRHCRFIGSQGCLEWDLIRNEVAYVAGGEEKILYSDPEWDKNQMYLEMIKDFLRLIRGEDNQCVLIDDAAETVALIEQVKQKFPKTDKY